MYLCIYTSLYEKKGEGGLYIFMQVGPKSELVDLLLKFSLQILNIQTKQTQMFILRRQFESWLEIILVSNPMGIDHIPFMI